MAGSEPRELRTFSSTAAKNCHEEPGPPRCSGGAAPSPSTCSSKVNIKKNKKTSSQWVWLASLLWKCKCCSYVLRHVILLVFNCLFTVCSLHLSVFSRYTLCSSLLIGGYCAPPFWHLNRLRENKIVIHHGFLFSSLLVAEPLLGTYGMLLLCTSVWDFFLLSVENSLRLGLQSHHVLWVTGEIPASHHEMKEPTRVSYDGASYNCVPYSCSLISSEGFKLGLASSRAL